MSSGNPIGAAIYIRRRVGRIRRSPCDDGGRGASQAQRALVEELGKELRGQAQVGMFRWDTIYKPSRRKLPTFYEVHRSSAPGGRVRAIHQQQRANRGQPTTFYYRGTWTVHLPWRRYHSRRGIWRVSIADPSIMTPAVANTDGRANSESSTALTTGGPSCATSR